MGSNGTRGWPTPLTSKGTTRPYESFTYAHSFDETFRPIASAVAARSRPVGHPAITITITMLISSGAYA